MEEGIRRIIEDYFRYNTSPVQPERIVSLFAETFIADYPSGVYKTTRSYVKHVRTTDRVARMLFSRSRVYALDAPQESSSTTFSVNWRFEYSWRFGLKGHKNGVNLFQLVPSDNDYGYLIDYVKTR